MTRVSPQDSSPRSWRERLAFQKELAQFQIIELEKKYYNVRSIPTIRELGEDSWCRQDVSTPHSLNNFSDPFFQHNHICTY